MASIYEQSSKMAEISKSAFEHIYDLYQIL